MVKEKLVKEVCGNMPKQTMLSLFSGSGGFELAGSLCGFEPVASSEIEPYPIAVTRSRFPNMKHLGSVTEVNGAEIEPVDIITFGSPCQDLSVAGKRAGLKHEDNGDEETTRSGLFMEAVRIIKEMREATDELYPRWAVWENVPGAFSSNNGEDFRIVLEELIKIVEPNAVMPPVPKGGWAYADSYCGDGWSLAYRVLDSQYIRTAQRRRRVYLVLDLAGQSARAVLFERQSLRGHPEKGRTPWQTVAGDAENCIGAADREGAVGLAPTPINTMLATRHNALGRGTGFGIGDAGDPQFTISAAHEHAVCYAEAAGLDGYNSCLTGDVSSTLGVNCGMSTGRNGVVVPYTLEPGIAAREGGHIYEGVSGTLRANAVDNQMAVAYADDIVLDDQGGSQISVLADGKSPTLRAEMHGNVPCVVGAAGFKAGQGARARSIGWDAEKCPTLASEAGGNSVPSVCIKEQLLFENHSQDTRYKGSLEVCPMLPAQLGTGGNNTPFVVEKNTAIPIHDQATRFSGKRGDKSDGKGNGLGVGEPGDPMNTLTSGDRHAVVYAIDQQGGKGGANYAEDVMPTLCADSHGTPHAVAYAQQTYQKVTGPLMANSHPGSYTGQDAFSDMLVAGPEKPIAIDRAFFNQGQNAQYDPALYEDGKNPTLVARDPNAVCVRYIVRRLTPTECARLQWFPDWWGEIDVKEDFTDEEYRFWLDVRNTHAVINGKAVKDYTKQQMLTWCNKLHTDSAEYRMWGNGVALSCCLYVMQGIADASV